MGIDGSMKIQIWILTWNNSSDLNEGLSYLFKSNAVSMQSDHDISINIINNHSNFKLDDVFVPYVKVWHNTLRPDFSTGHVARDWNHALVNGFQNLNSPACDLLITAHDDTWWGMDWLEIIEDGIVNRGYNFIAAGLGDNIMAFTPEAIKRIGLFDERFCLVGTYEHDYFFRAALYNSEKSSINDKWHMIDGEPLSAYEWNPLPRRDEILQRPPVNAIRHGEQMRTRYTVQHMGREFFFHKWGVIQERSSIRTMLNKGITRPLIYSYMCYPYFEKDVETIREQKYLWRDPYPVHPLPLPDITPLY